jgi:hypothetical protein
MDAAVSDQASAETAAGCQLCASWAPAESVGRISAAGLANLSGMAASWRNPGIIYVHNDRNVPRFNALGPDGALVGRFDLQGANVLDLEDMAVSRCAPGAADSCIYLADIGNNVTARTEFPIYRAVEPIVSAAGAGTMVTLLADRFTFSYADGPHNAESLLVDPATGTVYVITKEAAGVRSSVYRLTSFDPGRTNTAVKVQELPVPAADDQPATASSAHPCAAAFLLRTGNRLYEFRAPAGGSFAQAFTVPPVSIPVGPDPQGEAVTYAPDGRATYTTGEGAAVPLHRSLCR